MISKMFAKIPPAFRLHKTQKGESPHIENSPLLSQLPKVPFMALGGINDPGCIKCPRRHSSHHRFNPRTPGLSIAGRRSVLPSGSRCALSIVTRSLLLSGDFRTPNSRIPPLLASSPVVRHFNAPLFRQRPQRGITQCSALFRFCSVPVTSTLPLRSKADLPSMDRL